MTEKERISQLEELTAESLRKLDIVVGDVAAIRTAQLRTMHVVAGNTEVIGVVLDRIDNLDVKVDTLDVKVDTLDVKVDTLDVKVEEVRAELAFMKVEFTGKMDGFESKLDEIKSDLDLKFNLLMQAVQELKK